MKRVELIYQLQCLELRIKEIENEISLLKEESEIEKKFKKLKEEFEKDKKFIEEKQKELRFLNIDLQENLDKQKSHKAKSSRITNPKELTKLEKEIEYLKEKQIKIEDKILEIMEYVENKDKEIKEREKILKIEEENLKNEKEEKEKRIKELQEELSLKSHQLENSLKITDEETLQIYKELKKEKEGVAVAEVFEGACSCCNIALTTAQLSKLKNSEELIFCENCERILYYKEEVS